MERPESERERSMDKQGGVVPRTVGEDEKGRPCWHANAVPADTLPPLLQEREIMSIQTQCPRCMRLEADTSMRDILCVHTREGQAEA